MAQTHVYGKIKAVKNHIIVCDMEFGERRTQAGLLLLDDNGVDRGIRPRWGKVYAVGTGEEEIKVGQYVLISHGRWTNGVDVTGDDNVTVTIRRVDNKDILMVSDEKPVDEYVGKL